jgi:phosphatidyl-myo-inositol dimannoside synthase
MKIVLLTSEFPPFRGGVATYALEMARAATMLGHRVTVVAPDYGEDLSRADSALPFVVRRFRGGPNSPRALLNKVWLVARLSLTERPDVVHAVDWPFFLPLALSRFRLTARCLLTFHGTEINMMKRPSRSLLLWATRFWNGWALAVANSRYTAQHLLRTFQVLSPDAVRAIPLGVRANGKGEQQDHTAARQLLNVNENDFLILTLGRVVSRKGHHVIAEALSMVTESVRKSCLWYVVGPPIDPHYYEQIKAAADATGVRAIFTGSVAAVQLEQLLAAADLLCVPSVWGSRGEFEGFGLVYLEAGLYGVPSLATSVGGIPDAVIDGETGLLVQPEDPMALATALERLHGDSSLRTRLAAGARAHAQASSWEKVARETYAELRTPSVLSAFRQRTRT